MGHRVYIIAGEASGDMHAANLVAALRQRDNALQIRGWGGDRMMATGVHIVKHYRDLAFMGFTEVLKNIGTIMRNFRFCREDITAFNPDVLILVDYPGFNLRMAKWAHQRGIKVFYYISPQIWAWKQGRVHDIKKYVDRMFVVLPFESEFYKKFDCDVSYNGHPLLDEMKKIQSRDPSAFREKHGLGDGPVIALLPGSRKQEINTMLPLMLSVVDAFKNYRFAVAAAPSQPDELYRDLCGNKQVVIVKGDTYGLLNVAEAALVTSGTATLETALLGIPQVVCYKGGTISYHIARRLIKVKYISLVNLILDRPAVTELIQHQLNQGNLTTELRAVCEGGSRRSDVQLAYRELGEQLKGEGASDRTASEMLKILTKGL
jgi:lipid-A-disaccharide synthase